MQIKPLSESYHPFIFWRQSKENVILRVILADSTNHFVDFQKQSLKFNAKGVGSNGLANYSFDISLFSSIVKKSCYFNVHSNEVTVTMLKKSVELWPSLIRERGRVAWILFDFKNFTYDSDEEAAEAEACPPSRQPVEVKVVRPTDSDRRRHEQEKAIEIAKEDWESLKDSMKNPLILYLSIFNLFQCAGFLCVFGILIHGICIFGTEFMTHAFKKVSDQMSVLLLASLLEIAHLYLGWTKGFLFSTILQVLGRNVVFFVILLPHQSVQAEPTTFWLFFCWSLIEIVRYPYYLLKLFSEEISFLTYLRYTISIPLYPAGFICEGKLIICALPLIENSRIYSIDLPNYMNFSFDMWTFLNVYFLGTLPAFVFLMRRMYIRRSTKIGPQPSSRAAYSSWWRYFTPSKSRSTPHRSLLSSNRGSLKRIKAQ